MKDRIPEFRPLKGCFGAKSDLFPEVLRMIDNKISI